MWNIEAETGYKPQTTFWDDFSIADAFGENAIRDTYKRAMDSWKDNYIYLTELVMVLNWKIWQYYEEDNVFYQDLYYDLWCDADIYACNNLTGDELDYFYKTTD